MAASHKQVAEILEILKEAYPTSGFIIIKTDVKEVDGTTQVEWACNLLREDAKLVLNSTIKMADQSSN